MSRVVQTVSRGTGQGPGQDEPREARLLRKVPTEPPRIACTTIHGDEEYGLHEAGGAARVDAALLELRHERGSSVAELSILQAAELRQLGVKHHEWKRSKETCKIKLTGTTLDDTTITRERTMGLRCRGTLRGIQPRFQLAFRRDYHPLPDDVRVLRGKLLGC